VVATSAVRDARNRDALLSAVRERTGLGVRVLSAEEEARYGYLAAVNSTTLRDGVVLDLGGGSLQLVSVRDRQAVGSASWPLGAVRVTERFFADGGTVPRKPLERARAALHRELTAGALPEPAGGRAVAMGGAVRNLAAAVQRANGSASTGIQGFVLEADELRALLARLAKPRGGGACAAGHQAGPRGPDPRRCGGPRRRPRGHENVPARGDRRRAAGGRVPRGAPAPAGGAAAPGRSRRRD